MKIKQIVKNKITLVIVACGLFLLSSGFSNSFFEIAKQIEIFTTLYKELNINYVDETNPADLMTTGIKSMLKTLDPYTKFLNEQDVEAARINTSGDYTGIGAHILTTKNKLIVLEPYKGYPADKAGLKAGDEITKVNGIDVNDFKEDSKNLLKGEAGSTVEVSYLRQNKPFTTSIKREAIEIKAVPFFAMTKDSIGYIALVKFNRKASYETKKALVDLKKQGAKKIILDLRNNPGGLLREAINVTNLFVPKNQLIVTTKSKVKKYNKTYLTKNDPIDVEIPLAIIINDRSASASEIVSGSLQDLDRAVIIGNRSYGKGLVQRPKKLSYGTQMKITISRYYTPSGRCIQALDYSKKDDKGNALKIDKSQYNAFKTKKGRTVYDGGGINPDIKVEFIQNQNLIKAIKKERLVFDFATKYFYENENKVINDLIFDDKLFKDFNLFVKEKGFNFETKTELLLDQLNTTAFEEGVSVYLDQDLKTIKKHINSFKSNAIDQDKIAITQLLSESIIKRYLYKEGYYNYALNNDIYISRSRSLLCNLSTYNSLLN